MGETMKEYAVIYEQGETGWSAYVPDLPICVATGKTFEQVQKRITEGIAFHIQGLEKDGLPVPEPVIRVGIVKVAA